LVHLPHGRRIANQGRERGYVKSNLRVHALLNSKKEIASLRKWFSGAETLAAEYRGERYTDFS
jgi:hypothetical protein